MQYCFISFIYQYVLLQLLSSALKQAKWFLNCTIYSLVINLYSVHYSHFLKPLRQISYHRDEVDLYRLMVRSRWTMFRSFLLYFPLHSSLWPRLSGQSNSFYIQGSYLVSYRNSPRSSLKTADGSG
jgi:hypothetical protein